MQTMKLQIARALVGAGSVRSAALVGQPGGWAVVLRVGVVDHALETKRGGVRLFRSMEAARRTLGALGVQRFDVDASQLAEGLRLG